MRLLETRRISAVLFACSLVSCASYEYRQLALASPLLRVQVEDREALTPGWIAGVATRAASEKWQLESLVVLNGPKLDGACDDYGNVWVRLSPDRWEELLRSEATLECTVRAGRRAWKAHCRLFVPEKYKTQMSRWIGSMLIPHWELQR